ncbi:MAG: type II toxin-antitoxin system VapC family toxin [Terracidiphilus sp.]
MIILDTNVISALMRPRPDAEVIRWLNRQPHTSMWTTSVSIFEIESGLQTMPLGKRQATMAILFREWLQNVVQGRIASFDSGAAACAAELVADRLKRGRPGELRDTMIAGIVLASHATLATRNVKHFGDIAASVVNPWD